MNLFCSGKMIKQMDIAEARPVFSILREIARALETKAPPEALRKYNNKPMKGAKNVWKFYTDKSNRIIWSYGRHLAGTRPEEADDIFLLAYANHDEQGRIAADISRDVNRRNFYRVETNGPADRESPGNGVRFTNAQVNFIKGGVPMMISGGAGNGKTLVLLEKLRSHIETYDERQAAYFTLTEKLRQNAMEIHGRAAGSSGACRFFSIYDYFMESLGLDPADFVRFHRFAGWYGGRKDAEAFEAIDIWVEIRGTIKGYAGIGWKRNAPFGFNLISEASGKFLTGRGHLANPGGDRKLLRCASAGNDAFEQMQREVLSAGEMPSIQKDAVLADIAKIQEYAKANEYRDPMIGIQDYLDMDNDLSMHPGEDKRKIYKIAAEYQEWLTAEGLFDDNDMALAILREGRPGLFGFIAVDEIQDIPEIQILALVSLLKDRRNVVFSGDIHQIIQPTIFNPARLSELYSGSLKNEYLKVNHRSQGQIVDFTNDLSELRRHIIGRRKIESELREEAVWRGMAPYFLDDSGDNCNKAIEFISRMPNAAIVVSDRSERLLLEKYTGGEAANIYTVDEIKGLEFDYIFCKNLIGRNADRWREIFEGRARHSGRHRYYFNILYIAATRARESLCFCESSGLYGITELRELFAGTIRVSGFNAAALGMDTGREGPSEWKAAAERLEKFEVYDKAALYYAKAGETGCEERCRILHMINCGSIGEEEAMSLLFEAGEDSAAHALARKFGNKNMEFLGHIRTREFSVEDLEADFGEEYIMGIYLSQETSPADRKIIEEKYLVKKIAAVRRMLVRNRILIKKQTGGER
ncbi:MAG: AAA family ATPase [Clostridia bacterium]|nr:AAA family ATPase [Clostridia bacterium]